VHLLFLSSAEQDGAASHTRNLILAEAGSRATVVESHHTLGRHAAVVNAVTEIVAGEDAYLEHGKFQDQNRDSIHLASVHACMEKDSRVWSHSIALGARLARNDIRATLAGEGVEGVLNGLYLTRGDQVIDHHMVVDHARPHTASHEYFNGILADRSRGVFHGRILVQKEAQKTDAKQTNKNLLLSDQATANAKPQLEIYADDVKCTHGATIGQLNDESIYYLRSRGIGLETARRMLIHAFAGEIIDRVKHDALREELDALVWDRLEQHEGVAVGK
jgi:Fe-S cluster assembly protein SufD